jgi:hypothetical protein
MCRYRLIVTDVAPFERQCGMCGASNDEGSHVTLDVSGCAGWMVRAKAPSKICKRAERRGR